MSTTVVKSIDPIIDVGNLLAVDLQPLDTARLQNEREEYVRSVTRDNLQLLVNEVWKLPAERAEDAVVVALPPGTTLLPREKPVPKPRPPTKWEKYAKQKGIVKRKRLQMVYDEEAKEYKPRHGYKRVNDEKAVWALPVPEQGDPMEDQFEKRANAKKERVAKNEVQRLRNIARSQKGGLKAVQKSMATDAQAIRKAERDAKKAKVTKALSVAKTATASMGVHDTDVVAKRKEKGQRRKFQPVVGDFKAERTRHAQLAKKLFSDKPTVNVTKAVNRLELIEAEERRERPQKGRAQKGRPQKGRPQKGRPQKGRPRKGGPQK
ncbi:ribosome biogenesis regulatory protein homolog [Sycon ciliatum]|uniref:ribosome biogenesis regulatory protein homolog n=1 Tax=Sycon ciliatum TaxID=27933 RepID=UPI0020AE7F56|eukprot:scpid31450/ scgid19537/ Ribosome biogenesis regulatory protein homolog